MKLGKSNRDRDVRHVASIAVCRGPRILWLRRRDNGKWTLPGGHFNPGEEPLDAALRELREETGFNPDGGDIEVIGDGDVAGSDLRVWSFRVEIPEGEPTAANDPDAEAQEFQWLESPPGAEEQHVPPHKNITMQLLGFNSLQDLCPSCGSEPGCNIDCALCSSLQKAEPHWRSKDGLQIPRGGTPARRAWDKKYHEQVVKIFANGDSSRLKPVTIPVSEHLSGHFVQGAVGAGGRDRRGFYRRMLAAGEKLPPLIVRRNGISWHVVDGNARLHAALKHGATELQALELVDPAAPKLRKAEQARSLVKSAGLKPAFRHRTSSEIHVTPGYHDPALLPGGSDWDESDEEMPWLSDYEDGFVDSSGAFLNRRQAAEVVREKYPEAAERGGLVSEDLPMLKGWPRDEAENQANAHHHAVTMDDAIARGQPVRFKAVARPVFSGTQMLEHNNRIKNLAEAGSSRNSYYSVVEPANPTFTDYQSGNRIANYSSPTGGPNIDHPRYRASGFDPSYYDRVSSDRADEDFWELVSGEAGIPPVGSTYGGGEAYGRTLRDVRRRASKRQKDRDKRTGVLTKNDDLVPELVSHLSDDLRKPKYQGNKNPMAGHCYVASEAAYHLLGGHGSGWVPQNVQHEGDQHWYLKHRDTGQIFDPTASQFKTPVPYEKGRGRGFLTAEPSRRAQILIDRVRGQKALQKSTVPKPEWWRTPSRKSIEEVEAEALARGFSHFHIMPPEDVRNPEVARAEIVKTPSIPQAPMAGEDTTVPRVSLGPGIWHCLAGVAGCHPSEIAGDPDTLEEIGGGKHLWHIYGVRGSIPGHKTNAEIQQHVPDAHLTGESWATQPVKMEHLAQIGGGYGPDEKYSVWTFKPKALQKGLSGALAAGLLNLGSPHQAPEHPQPQKVVQQPTWSPEGLDPELLPIAHLESSFGQNVNHAPNARGDYHTAVGALGLKPVTAHEEWLHHSTLQKQFPGLEDPAAFTQALKTNNRLYNGIASAHWRTLRARHGSPETAAYAWRHGSGAARAASPEQVLNEIYVQKYRHLATNPLHKSEELLKAYEDDPEFRSWYGESRLKTPEGRPLRVFRGTRRPDSKGYLKTPSYTDSPDVASIYAGTPGDTPKYNEGATVHPSYLQMKNPLDISNHGIKMSFGDYLKVMQYGQPNGMTHEEAQKVLNYFINRKNGKVKAGDFEHSVYQSDPDEDPDTEEVETDLGDILRGRTDLHNFKDDFEEDDTPQNTNRLHADTFAFVDAPRTAEVAQRLGYDGIIHSDVIGSDTPAKELLGKKPQEVVGASRIYSGGLKHKTYRPFKQEQVRSALGPPVLHTPPQDIEKSLSKSIDDLKPGRLSEDGYDFSHLVPQKLRPGMRLTASTTPDNSEIAVNLTDLKTGKKIGQITAQASYGSVNPGLVHLNQQHHGMGLGTAMYEALFGHAYHNLGIKHVAGGSHTELASAVHRRLGDRHGRSYSPDPADEAYSSEGVGPYSYFLKTEAVLQKSIDDLKPGKLTRTPEYDEHDFTHLLKSPVLKRRYRLVVKTARGPHASALRPAIYVHLYDRRDNSSLGQVGRIDASLHGFGEKMYVNPGIVALQTDHRNKGLGAAMYEALFGYAYHHLGVKAVGGTHHSSMANRTHRSLTTKHGWPGYEPEKVGEASGPFDDAYGPYRYVLKSGW